MQKELILQEFEELRKAIVLLNASIEKFKPYKTKKMYTPNELEYYDSLSFRFEKAIELTLGFFKVLEIFLYGKVSDTLRDRLLIMQKLHLIDNIDFWIEARILRNKIAHTYITQELKNLYSEIFKNSTTIFKTGQLIENYIRNRSDR